MLVRFLFFSSRGWNISSGNCAGPLLLSELVVVKENGALSEADGYYRTCSFGGRLDLGWRALQCVEHNAESLRLMQVWREVGVSSCALLHRAIARSDTRCVARALTCLNSVKLPARAFIKVKVYTEGSQDRTHGQYFRDI